MYARCLLIACILSLFLAKNSFAEPILREDFDSLPSGKSIDQIKKWRAFPGFPGKSKPSAVVMEKVGVGGSSALAVSHGDKFRSDGQGLHIPLPKTIGKGELWIQCKFQPPKNWHAGIYLDARSKNAIVSRMAGNHYLEKDKSEAQIRWHASWARSYWRLYTKTKLDTKHWYLLTARLDLDRGTYAAWIDDQPLGQDLPLCANQAITHLYLGFGGAKDDPALVDDLIITQESLTAFTLPAFYPQPSKDLIFRFAAVGDPQLGFGGYETDLIRFKHAVKQINESGAEFTIVLGDMVHKDDQEKAYQDVKQAAEELKKPCYYVRGNHDRKDFFKKYFHPQLDFSFVHNGMRFMVIDAIGNHAGLSAEQLKWIEEQFQEATKAQQEIAISLHVSPWESNSRGKGKYNQIGKGRDQLRALMKKHKVLLSLSGHYHQGLWHQRRRKHTLLCPWRHRNRPQRPHRLVYLRCLPRSHSDAPKTTVLRLRATQRQEILQSPLPTLDRLRKSDQNHSLLAARTTDDEAILPRFAEGKLDQRA